MLAPLAIITDGKMATFTFCEICECLTLFEQMNLFPPNNILEEEIFTPRNLGPDCDIIGGLLERFGEKFILSALEDGEYAIAVDHYLQLLDSLTAHFIADEHWCWFDDSIPRTTLCRIYGTRLFPISVPVPWPVSLWQSWNPASSR